MVVSVAIITVSAVVVSVIAHHRLRRGHVRRHRRLRRGRVVRLIVAVQYVVEILRYFDHHHIGHRLRNNVASKIMSSSCHHDVIVF